MQCWARYACNAVHCFAVLCSAMLCCAMQCSAVHFICACSAVHAHPCLLCCACSSMRALLCMLCCACSAVCALLCMLVKHRAASQNTPHSTASPLCHCSLGSHLVAVLQSRIAFQQQLQDITVIVKGGQNECGVTCLVSSTLLSGTTPLTYLPSLASHCAFGSYSALCRTLIATLVHYAGTYSA
jgi:hypothetical protein